MEEREKKKKRKKRKKKENNLLGFSLVYSVYPGTVQKFRQAGHTVAVLLGRVCL